MQPKFHITYRETTISKAKNGSGTCIYKDKEVVGLVTRDMKKPSKNFNKNFINYKLKFNNSIYTEEHLSWGEIKLTNCHLCLTWCRNIFYNAIASFKHQFLHSGPQCQATKVFFLHGNKGWKMSIPYLLCS